jgi:two-component system chemotaxis response regulator CheY
MKILVADDSKAMRMIVVRTLRQAGLTGHDILEAEDGQQALTMVGTEAPDLILSDWNMPNMTGIEFLRALRSEGSEEMRGLAAGAGALGVIAKPFTPEQFLEVIGTVVSA